MNKTNDTTDPLRQETPTRMLLGIRLHLVAKTPNLTYHIHEPGLYEVWRDATEGWVVSQLAYLPPRGVEDVTGHQAGFRSLSAAVWAIAQGTLNIKPEPPSGRAP
jgi:hypothetical protein